MAGTTSGGREARIPVQRARSRRGLDDPDSTGAASVFRCRRRCSSGWIAKTGREAGSGRCTTCGGTEKRPTAATLVGEQASASRGFTGFARARAADGALVLVGCSDEEALTPYQPFVEALSWYVRVCPEPELRAQLTAVGGGAELARFIPGLLHRFPDLPALPPMGPEGQRYRLFEGVAAILADRACAAGAPRLR
jgi:hypothetical protein